MLRKPRGALLQVLIQIMKSTAIAMWSQACHVALFSENMHKPLL